MGYKKREGEDGKGKGGWDYITLNKKENKGKTTPITKSRIGKGGLDCILSKTRRASLLVFLINYISF